MTAFQQALTSAGGLIFLLKAFKPAEATNVVCALRQAKPAVQQRVLALDAADYDPQSKAQQLQFACLEAAADTLLSSAAGAASIFNCKQLEFKAVAVDCSAMSCMQHIPCCNDLLCHAETDWTLSVLRW